MPAPAILTLTNVTKTYPGGVHALQGITLDIPTGLFGLLGPNGAGKSTLMRTIATLQAPSAGSIVFDNVGVLQDRMALRRILGYLPQEFGTYPRTSAEAMLRHYGALKGLHGDEQHTAVAHQLHRTGLWDVRHRSVDTFSGGMKQRFGIAQALLGTPRLVIVDEPTAGLDPAERRRFQNLLAEVGEDVVVILSTHIVEDVAGLCPRLAIMGQGRILVHGEVPRLIDELAGRVWTTVTSRAEAARLGAAHVLLGSRLRSGQCEVRILADAPPPGWVAAAPELEDVYFATLHDARLNAAVA
jgi:ABC-2 type transport system ATP-binding protein